MTRPGVPTTTCAPRLAAPAAAGRSSGRRRSAARGSPAGARRSSGTPRRPGSPARASAPAPAPAACVCVEIDARQDRQRERGGLAGAGLRLAEHVAARQQRRDGRGLDRRGRSRSRRRPASRAACRGRPRSANVVAVVDSSCAEVMMGDAGTPRGWADGKSICGARALPATRADPMLAIAGRTCAERRRGCDRCNTTATNLGLYWLGATRGA